MDEAAKISRQATSWDAARREARMLHVTWGTVAAAFLTWVVLVVLAARWAGSVLETSAANAPSTLAQTSGVVFYREPDQRAESAAQPGTRVFDGDEIATSFGSTATLEVFDGTVIEMFPEARLHVDATRIGRLNQSATRALFTLVAGTVRLSIPQMANKPHTLNVASPHGAAAFVPGQYTVRVGRDATRISVWEGRTAVAIGDDIIEVIPGQKIELAADRKTFFVHDLLENVVANGAFERGLESWEPFEVREQGRPDVPGRREVVQPPERGTPDWALQVFRSSQIDAANETGVRQILNWDVKGAREIRVQARVRVDLASLSGGGYVGSEYPMMMRIRYRDTRGGEQSWTRGFYYANPENRPVPNGERVARGQWTDLDLDLGQLLNQPSVIDSIELFGAGHTFDAQIAEVALLVD